MLSRIEFIHSRYFLHRDIKPDNFIIGLGKRQHLIYVIDFGLAKRYRDARSGEHIPYREGKSLTGTARYASLDTHLGKEQGRKDDLEGLGYIMIYFLKGQLPWQGLQAKNKDEKYRKIKDRKSLTPIDTLCKGLPKEFQRYLNYVRKLKFDDKPDYQFLKSMLQNLFYKNGYEYDYMYDWVLKKKGLPIDDGLSQKDTKDKENINAGVGKAKEEPKKTEEKRAPTPKADEEPKHPKIVEKHQTQESVEKKPKLAMLSQTFDSKF